MKNLESNSIIIDFGEASIEIIKSIEKVHNIKLPQQYIDFITKHNGASIFIRCFDYFDPNRDRKSSDSIAFVKAENIERDINLLQNYEGQIVEEKDRFPNGLIPFGDNGGGDCICFDYRSNQMTDEPPIVIWNHEGPDFPIVFIAKNFEEFINMLYVPKDE